MNFYNMVKKKYVNLNQILIDNKDLLKLNQTDIKVVDYLIYQEESIIIENIVGNTGIKSLDVKDSVNALIKKGYLELEFKDVNGKLQESFSFKELLDTIFNLFSNKKKSSNEKTRVIELFEERTNKQIKPLDVQMIHKWYESGKTENDVLEAIKQAIEIDKLSVKYVDGILNKKKKVKDEFSDGKGDLIYEFCTEWKSN